MTEVGPEVMPLLFLRTGSPRRASRRGSLSSTAEEADDEEDEDRLVSLVSVMSDRIRSLGAGGSSAKGCAGATPDLLSLSCSEEEVVHSSLCQVTGVACLMRGLPIGWASPSSSSADSADEPSSSSSIS